MFGVATLVGEAGVFFLDVNEFKSVNDNYGHHIGDDLLKSIAEFPAARLARAVRLPWPRRDEYWPEHPEGKTV